MSKGLGSGLWVYWWDILDTPWEFLTYPLPCGLKRNKLPPPLKLNLMQKNFALGQKNFALEEFFGEFLISCAVCTVCYDASTIIQSGVNFLDAVI